MPQEQTNLPSPSPQEPLGRRQRKALAVHRALLDAGLASFDRQPIAMVSVLDITEAADVSKGVFYLHFKSKDEFVIALWEDVQRALLDAIRGALTAADSFRARVQCVAAQYRHFAASRSRTMRFGIRMSGYLPDDIGRPGRLTELRRGFLAQLAALIGGVKDAGSLTPQLQQTAEIVDGCCWALIAQAVLLETELSDEECFVRVVAGATEAGQGL